MGKSHHYVPFLSVIHSLFCFRMMCIKYMNMLSSEAFIYHQAICLALVLTTICVCLNIAHISKPMVLL